GARARVLEQAAEPLERDGEVRGDRTLDRGDEADGHDVLERARGVEQPRGRAVQVLVHRALAARALPDLREPGVRALSERGLALRREHVRDRTVPELHRERLGPAERGGTEVVGLEVGVEAREQRGSGLVQQMAQLGGHPGRELLGERAALAREDGLEEVAQPLVERFAEARLRDRAGEVFARQQTRADRAADRRGQAGLVLGDRALEGPEPAAPQPGRLVRMKQHPDRDRVRDAARERTEQNGERELEHGRDHPWPRRTSPYTARRTPRSSTQPRTTNSAT